MKKSLLKFFLIAIMLIISFSVLSACNNVDFKIEFIVDGEVYATVSTNGSETIKMPEDPEKKGYSFDGWFWDEGVWKKPFTVNSLLENPLSENMKVYAKWIEESKASDFSVSGFEKTDDNVFCKVVDNETKSMSFSDIVEADPSAEWVLTSDIGGKDVIPSKAVSLIEGDNKFYVMVTDPDDKVSVYEINVRRKIMYTVTFDTDGGEEVEPQKVQEGDYVLIPQTAKKGYNFVGWSKDLTQAVTENIYVTAIWEAKTYTAVFDAVGGNVDPDRVTVTFGNTFELPTPDRKGYQFIEWQNAEGQATDGIWSYDKDLTFTAIWEAKTYTAVLDAAGGNVDPDRVTVTFGNTFELPTPDRNGYEFVGWQNVEGQAIDGVWSYDKDLTFTATWREINGEYTYNSYTLVSPEDWNELTYWEDSDKQIVDYIRSPLFEFDYAYDDNGNIVPGSYKVEYAAATMLEDVTARYAAKYRFNAEDKGYVWKITLREDLVWDDGTPITAADFVYSMKEQLNPLFRNYRADSYYNSGTVIHNAQGYAKQGLVVDETVSNLFSGIAAAKEAGYTDLYLDMNAVNVAFGEWFGGSYAQVKEAGLLDFYFMMYENGEALGQNFFAKYDLEVAENGQILVTDEMIADYAKCDNWDAVPDADVAKLSVINGYVYPEIDFEDVGIFVGDNEYELVLVLDKALPLLNEDGTLSYIAAYEFSLPLVKRDLYEMCKKAPDTNYGVWTTDYNTSVETSASWGPYKLTEYIQGEKYVLERNENWYGYSADIYEGQYQTDRIVCVTCENWEEAWLKFQNGEIDDVSLDVSIASDYKGSEQAYFTPTDFVFSFQLQSNEEALKNRESEGINKTILTYTEFRKALSLGIDRVAYASACTTGSIAGFGIFNSMHYYDVEKGLVYRESDEAKRVLCNVYGIDVSKYASLDDAVDAITGYDLAQARALIDQAYDKAIADGKMKEGDKVQLVWGTTTDNENTRRQYEFVKNAWTELMVGTKLEGKFELIFDASFGDNWAIDFRNGDYDVCAGGWTGAAWDPGYFLLAYLSPDYMYSADWDTYAQMMTFTMPVEQEDGSVVDTELTMSLMDWYNCLNGNTGSRYDWSANAVSQEVRLPLIAALEEQVLLAYYTLPMYNEYSASLISFKTDYISYEYNTFMGYGGVRYMTYNYTDGEWADYVSSQGGQLNYK